MRALRWVVVGVLVVALAAAVSAAGKQDQKLMKEVEAIGDAVARAMLADDVEAMLAMYTADAISLPNYGPRMEGIETFREHHAQMAASGMKIRSFTSDPTDVWQCGNQVIEIGTYAIELNMPGMPEPIQDRGKYMTVYVRGKDGGLKIKAEIWNTDMNPMEMGAHGHEHE